ncbi:MAG: ABC transporter ATP-binding protein [Gammaproteobacteria bacterium]|nr:ABC transporter ATP-binding protein [Gammaproteobacteria bacterium]MCW8988369.1 ABC transporter ATP-binding protein [Gammaproteobacteria bacterium]MCW9030889.1 ABC transporter ATP-binding protein [Gammaproteobacteria bacterium]
MENKKLLSVKHLSRFYGSLAAVNSISFHLNKGEVLGFLGPNGAGKSTTMQVITGNLAPSAGQIDICGFDLIDSAKQAKANIGYLPEQPPLYREFTVDEYLLFCAQLNRIEKSKQNFALTRAKERCGLTQVGHRLINNLSKGYQQRVGIAQAIIHSPEIVILDEPTVGLDPIQIKEIRTLIRELAQDHGVILSTHILPEVQMTCDRVQIINHGQLVYSDDINHLHQRMRSNSIILGLNNPPAETELKSLTFIDEVEVLSETRFRLSHALENSPAENIAQIAADKKWGLFEIRPEQKTLEQVFVELTSGEVIADEADTEKYNGASAA